MKIIVALILILILQGCTIRVIHVETLNIIGGGELLEEEIVEGTYI